MSRDTPEHELNARGLRFAIITARFNGEIAERLAGAAAALLEQRGAAAVERTWHVPGAFELPLAARWCADSGRFDAVLAFGAVVRGETEHFRLVADASSNGLLRVSLDTGVPVLNGVLAVHDRAQADARSGGALGNRGTEVALAAIEMARLYRQVRA
ncbi:MAG: 6,7-dimethyl-8-ribityllumazine synthase [Candidatus Eiseniibacteriota bacterium]